MIKTEINPAGYETCYTKRTLVATSVEQCGFQRLIRLNSSLSITNVHLHTWLFSCTLPRLIYSSVTPDATDDSESQAGVTNKHDSCSPVSREIDTDNLWKTSPVNNPR